jgi:energy-coupling factor transporter ATP-binding protein EcfA2
MGQRLGIASALLGDPPTVILDEPVNGLDPEGILWVRNLMKSLAAEGRTVFVSSHLMSEMALTADHLIVIGRGQLLAGKHAGVSLADPGVLSAVFGSGLYLTLVAVLGFGLGTAIRHTAGALAAFFGVLFAPSALVDLLPTSWRNTVIEYLPANAGSQILTLVHKQGALSAWAGLGVFGLYALGAVLAGFALCGRDS